jgi:glycosyltransferase involved in cell wall biosynthesis
MSDPLISIILPVYNGEKYLSQSIESCLIQTYKNLELIIVDDCSTDNSLAIARSYSKSDERVKIIKNKINKKLPASLNIGHRAAKGDYITWTSDDNFYQKDAIKKLLQVILDKKVDIVYTDNLIINDEGILVGQAYVKDIEYLLFYGVIGACFLYKKEVFERNEGYREDLFLIEDYDFWLRALKHSKFSKVNNPGYYFYRYHKGSLTIRMKNDKDLKEKFIKNLHILYSNLFNAHGIKEKKFLIEFLINRFLYGPHIDIRAVEGKHFFHDLHLVSSSFLGFSYTKVKRIILNDVVETILRKKQYQRLTIFIDLHRVGRSELLRLPINRYLALVKKCIF